MLTRILLVLAVCGALFAAFMTVRGSRDVKAAPPAAPPAEAPFKDHSVAGSALIEPASENIAIGAPASGLVVQIAVKSGDRVKAGDLLFRLDDRSAKAALAAAEAAWRAASASAEAQAAEVRRLEESPRVETVAPRKAALAVAEAQLADIKDQLATLQSVTDPRAVQRVDLDRRRFAAATAAAVVEQARGEYLLASAKAWEQDLAVARARFEAAKAQAEAAKGQADAAKVALDILSVTAPVEGQVLRVNVRPGEFSPMPLGGRVDPSAALMVMGDTRLLHVRVDIDENDAWRVKAGARAKAFARGNRDIEADLRFVRIEPLVVPKRSLTGDSTERVDTRVLQAIFAFEPGDKPLFVGQQMDVYIEDK